LVQEVVDGVLVGFEDRNLHDLVAFYAVDVAASDLDQGPLAVEALLHDHCDAQRAHDPLAVLTARERDVLALMAEGRSNHGIGERLFLSPKTVETHVHRIFRKLELPPAAEDHRRVLAVLAFLRDTAE
jgi:DNA-binding NarL/FixJ family response regulator